MFKAGLTGYVWFGLAHTVHALNSFPSIQDHESISLMTGHEQLSVPPGFRFHPTDEELLYYYLRKKVSYEPIDLDVIREIDLNKLEPWDLKDKCRVGSDPQNEWYFFSHKDKKYPTGTRTNRATVAGFWKATGRDKAIYVSSARRIGMRKTLVFYTGRAPHGQKTDWIMHEYRLDDDSFTEIHEDGWVVCRVFKRRNHTRGYNPEFDHDEATVAPPLTATACGGSGIIPNQKHDSDHLPPYNYVFLHNNSMHLPQLLSADTALPPPLLASLPLPTAVAGISGGLFPPEKISGDWSFLDNLLATHQAMDQLNKGQQQLSQVADLVPNQRFPFYYNGFEEDLSRYSN